MKVLFTIGWLLVVTTLWAQQRKQLPLLDALAYFEKEQSIKFSFDPETLDLVSKELVFEVNDLDEFIQDLENRLPFSVEKIDGQYYTLSPMESNYYLTAIDSTDSKPITEEIGMYVLINGKSISVNAQGDKWTFSYLPKRTDKVEVYSLGFEREVISFEDLLSGKDLAVQLSLSVVQLENVLVKDYLTKGINLDPSNQSIRINVSDLPLLPGETDGDIFASLAALPGITNPDGRAGNLFIRGSESDRTLVLFDNIPVYHRGHYYGTISPYNPKVVDNVEVYRSGFHPRLGDRVGGAVVINSGEGKSTEPNIGVGANTLYGMGYVKLPVSDKLGVSFGARHSYSSDFLSPKLEAISKSVFSGTGLVDQDGELRGDIMTSFHDYHGKLLFRPTEKSTLSFSGIYTQTEVNYSVEIGPQNPMISDVNTFNNSGFNIEWENSMNNRWMSKFTATVSDYEYAFISADNRQIEIRSINELKDLNLRQEFSKTNEGVSYVLGVDYKWQEAYTDYQNILEADQSVLTYSNTVQANSASPYVNVEFEGWEKWYLQIGVRSTYYDILEDFRVSPRMLVNYDLTNNLTLKGSTGWYNQYLSQVKNLEFGGGGFDNELWTLANDQQGNVIHGQQSMMGAIYNRKEWIVDVEVFTKTANNITVYEDRKFTLRSIYFTMDQTTGGIDLMVKRQIGDNASAWVGYSYHDSKITLDTTDQVSYASKYVQPDVWYVGGAFKQSRWKFSAGYEYKSGLNAQSLDIVYAELLFRRMVQNNPPGTPPPPNPFADLPERYPNVHMLNVSASYKIPQSDSRKWQASFGLSLVNLLNQENLIDRVFRSNAGFVDRYAIGFAPNLMVTVEW